MGLLRLSFVVGGGLVLFSVFNLNTHLGDRWRHRPWWLLFLNHVIPRFDLEPAWFLRGHEDALVQEGLRVLVTSMNTEANLTALGKVFAYWAISDSLKQHDCVVRSLKETRFVPQAGFQSPLIVLGLPRFVSFRWLVELILRSPTALALPLSTGSFPRTTRFAPRDSTSTCRRAPNPVPPGIARFGRAFGSLFRDTKWWPFVCCSRACPPCTTLTT